MNATTAATHQLVVRVFAQTEDADGWSVPALIFPADVDIAKADDRDAEEEWASQAITEDEDEWARIIGREIAENGWVRVGATQTGDGDTAVIPVRRAE